MSAVTSSDDQFDGETLAQAKEWLRVRVIDGAVCPCCDRYARVYHRKLNRGMARSLINMYRHGGVDWQIVHLSKQREERKLQHWGLIECGQDRGLMRVLPHGVDWLYGRVRVPSHINEYDGRCIGIGGDPVTVADVLKEPFDFEELMASRPSDPW